MDIHQVSYECIRVSKYASVRITGAQALINVVEATSTQRNMSADTAQQALDALGTAALCPLVGSDFASCLGMWGGEALEMPKVTHFVVVRMYFYRRSSDLVAMTPTQRIRSVQQRCFPNASYRARFLMYGISRVQHIVSRALCSRGGRIRSG